MGLRLGCGVITCQRIAGSGRPFEDIYADELAYAVAAEEVGFDSVWLSEHHFTEDGYLSAIFPMMAAIAARTSRVAMDGPAVLAEVTRPVLHVAATPPTPSPRCWPTARPARRSALAISTNSRSLSR